MNILIVGSGAREHGLCYALAKSGKNKLFIAPGNAGIAPIAELVPIKANDFDALVNFAKSNSIDLTVCIMDEPLVLGIADAFAAAGLKFFGPSKKAAIIEGSKAYAKEFMQKYNIPTAEYKIFNSGDYEQACEYAKNASYPLVVKADGLALGKGVIICQNPNEALASLADIFVKKQFGLAGEVVVIEEFLEGEECSVLAFCDGKNLQIMPSAKDHKQIFDGNRGPNTGGMGVVSPVESYTKEISEICLKTIFEPTIKGLKAERREFVGIIFFGLMLTKNGPKVIEYNCRAGDPEFQTIIPNLETDLTHIIMACLDKNLDKLEVLWKNSSRVCVVAASGGYPGKYETGKIIKIADNISKDILIFYAGVAKSGNNFTTAGGRVLSVVAFADSIKDARKKAYEAIKSINFDGIYYRSDI